MALSHIFSGSVSTSTPGIRNASAPSAVDVGGTLTAANVVNGYNVSAAGAPGNVQFPTAQSIAAALSNPLGLRVGDSFLFFQYSTGANTVTMTGNTGLNLGGTMTTNASGGQFLFRCTTAPTAVDGLNAVFSVTRVG